MGVVIGMVIAAMAVGQNVTDDVNEALRELPDDVVALFVGAPIQGRDYMVDQFKEYALKNGVADRTRFMGFVPEEELERELEALPDVSHKIAPAGDGPSAPSERTEKLPDESPEQPTEI